jgi:mannose PTS system EIIA component
MIGILIITHGTLGESLMECTTHVLGKAPEQFSALAVWSYDDPQQLTTQALSLVAELDSGDGVLVLSDIYGATPCNIVAKLLKPGLIEGVAGVNLPMVVRAMTYRHEPIATLVEKAVSGGREGVVYFSRENCERYEQV